MLSRAARHVKQNYSGVIELGQPFALLSVDGATTTGGEHTLAFVSLVKSSELGK